MSDYILEKIGLYQEDFIRFRDCFVIRHETGECIIAVYTRCGGANRKHWNSYDGSSEGKSCRCPGCTITYYMPDHPNYIGDKDDDFDSTYATIFFSIPDKYKRDLEQFVVKDPKTVGEKFQDLIKDMQVEADTPLVRNAMDVGKKMLDQIDKALKK